MTDASRPDAPSATPLPADDPARGLVADPDDPALPHVVVGAGTCTVLPGGADTGGRACLIDVDVPPGGGPPPHRHGFEEMLTVLEGEVDVTFRAGTVRIGAGMGADIPADAPHPFRNASDRPARLLCMCAPPGREDCFLATGDLVAGSTTTPPPLGPEERGARVAWVRAPSHRPEILA